MVAVIERDARLLVIERSALVVAPGAFCFPGGGIEPLESEAEAIARELREELGIESTPLRRIWHSRTPWHVDLAWWHVAIDDAAEIRPNPTEVASVSWRSTSEIRALTGVLSSNLAFLDAIARGEIAKFADAL